MVVEGSGADGGRWWVMLGGILKTRSHCFVLGNAEADHQQSNVSCRSLPTAGTSLEALREKKEKKKRRKERKSPRGWMYFLSFSALSAWAGGGGWVRLSGGEESGDTNRCRWAALCRQNTQSRVHVDIDRRVEQAEHVAAERPAAAAAHVPVCTPSLMETTRATQRHRARPGRFPSDILCGHAVQLCPGNGCLPSAR